MWIMTRVIRPIWRFLYAFRFRTTLKITFFKEAIRFYKLTSKYNASIGTNSDIEKFQYTILRENHVLEKGMSMRNPRKGFGQEKVNAIIKKCEMYNTLFGSKDIAFLSYPLGTIKAYIEYTKKTGVEIQEIEKEYQKLTDKIHHIQIEQFAGIEEVSRNEILTKCDAGFKALLLSRHSIRYFSGEPVTQDVITEALEMAQRTPSACNRQGWKTHVFQGDKSVRLMKWQGGCHGFEEELTQSMLVTANLKAFMSYEVHQAYVDGGLYAMNLINAFHSLGIGGIPLSCGFGQDKLKKLSSFDIPENEVPILIFAFGNLPEHFKIAVSTRKSLSRTNIFH